MTPLTPNRLGQIIFEAQTVDHPADVAWLGREEIVAVCEMARRGAPEGWKLVPVEPTQEMEVAGSQSRTVHVECVAYVDAAIIYRAMLATTPPTPSESA